VKFATAQKSVSLIPPFMQVFKASAEYSKSNSTLEFEEFFFELFPYGYMINELGAQHH